MSVFDRDWVMHDLVARTLTVTEVASIAPTLVRVTFTADELAGFSAPGPADHVKVFFPDRASGISRDYTPVEFRANGAHGPELDIDFFVHGDDGPASAWAAAATPGDTLTLGGPRGSHLVPHGMKRLLIVADETALPAARRWIDAVGDDVEIEGFFSVRHATTSAYLTGVRVDARLHWFEGSDRDAQRETAIRQATVDDSTFAFLAGEARALVPLRRYLRRELGLAKEQVDAQGYWKVGEANLDHHAPLDPTDED